MTSACHSWEIQTVISRMNVQFVLESGKVPQGLPDDPGVYLFKDASGRVIYVGKAKMIRKRVQSYFKTLEGMSPKTALMMKKARGLDCILTGSENEAFILESTLIKKFLPRYNIILRDDKQYPCLRMDLKEPYPRLRIVRRIKKDGALYFGPFSSAHSVRSTLKVIDRIFQLRKCKDRHIPKRTRPCLNYQMDRCLGPCTVEVSKTQYESIVHQVRLFLDGRNRELIGQLKKEMGEAAERLDFERAARVRDQVRAVERTVERQHVVSAQLEDKDIIGMAEKESLVQVVLLSVRRGYLAGSRNFLFREQPGPISDVVEAFIKQYYAGQSFIPGEILIPVAFEDQAAVGTWMSSLAGRKVTIFKPMRGEKLRLVRMAETNAASMLAGRESSSGKELMDQMKDILKLEKAPRTLEAFDVSNLYGNMAVGTLVSFVDGESQRSGYRNYRIRAVNGIDDYGMMVEMVSRRLAKRNLPDLFVVDGGRGHLNVVRKLLERMEGTDATEVISIAKAEEARGEKTDKIYLPGRKNPVLLEANHPVLLFLMRVRDEVHRRAVGYHRALRKKALTASDLDRIPGIGEIRKKQLLQHFKSMEDLMRASSDEIAGVPGISSELAQRIVRFYENRGRPGA